MIEKRKKEDFTVRKNKLFIELLLNLNPKIFIKIDKNNLEQIYIDYITDNGEIIIYDNKFNKKYLANYISNKRNLKRASATLRFVYYSLYTDEKKRLYNYLDSINYN